MHKFAILLLVVVSVAFAQPKDRATIISETAASMPSGVQNNITAQKIRNALTDIVNAAPNFKADGVYSVKAYGATGNGTTDDTAAITACFAAAPAGAMILLPAGTYLTTTGHTISAANLTVIGYGATIKASTASVRPLTVTGSGVGIYGLTLDGAHNGTGTPSGTWEGLLNIVGSTSTAVERVTVQHCRFINSNSLGLRVLGNVTGATVTGCTFESNFIHFFAEPDGTYTYNNLTATGNQYGVCWYNSTYSGAIKFKGNGGLSLSPTGIAISNERIVAACEMGIELWDSINDSSVVDCSVDGTTFGISIDNGSNISILGNKVYRNAYCGIELANQVRYSLVKGNTIDEYESDGTTRGGERGIVSSGPSCHHNVIEGNVIRGVAHDGIILMYNHHVAVVSNEISDCESLVILKNCEYSELRANRLYGPCNYHVFLDFTDQDCTDLTLVENALHGAAANDNIVVYSGASGRQVSNLVIRGNGAYAASATGQTINISLPSGTTPNLQVFDNVYLPHGTTAKFTDRATAPELVPPYRSQIQQAGLSVAAKRVITAESSGSPQWVKLVSANYGNPLFLQLHVFAYNQETAPSKNAITAQIVGAPYGFDGSVTLLPSGNYFGGLVSEVIYDNPSGATQEVWLKIAASPSPVTLECYFSDYPASVILAPTFTGTEPTLGANSYRAQVEASTSTALQARSFWAREAITSAARGAIANEWDRGGRLHIRGPGVTSTAAQTRIARFDIADGTEATGIDDTGKLLVKKKLNVDGHDIAAIKSGEITDIDFGTINAGSSFGYDYYISGISTTNTPAGFFSFEGTFPEGLIVDPFRVTGTNYCRLVVRNPTGSNIAVGTKKVRAVVFQF